MQTETQHTYTHSMDTNRNTAHIHTIWMQTEIQHTYTHNVDANRNRDKLTGESWLAIR